MKILATSDLHGNLQGLEDYLKDIDIVCFAGDIAKLTGRGKWHIYDQKKWMQNFMYNFSEKYPNIEFVFVPGNHDFFPIAQQKFGVCDIDWRLYYPKNFHMLLDSEITVNGLRIYGSPWVPIISYTWAFEAESDKLKKQFFKIPENIDILLTHSPPHLSKTEPIDRSLQWGGQEAFGSSELTEALFNSQPKYAFCGHIHTGGHECFNVYNTKCYNVSRLDERYEIAYEPLILEI